ncbi:hypothetical protein F4814DRAFT_444665 [Daldinia grandis]|nr:hypothetical protein F4814DRAFT_444665 [Daldinia grandis]
MEPSYSSRSAHSGPSRHLPASKVLLPQESFDKLQFSVLRLALNDVWPDSTDNDIMIERLQGDVFNQVIGLTRKGNIHTNSAEVRYILRIPRREDSHVDRDATTLEFLERHTKISAPYAITFDETTDNEFMSPYMIQNRIPGIDASSGFPKLDHAGKLRFARELGIIFRQTLAVKSHTAGSLVFSPEHKDPKADFWVIPYRSEDTNSAVPYSSTKTATQTVRNLILSNFPDQIACDFTFNTPTLVELRLLDQLYFMAWELESRGWFTNVHCCLAHLDLAPCNILINPTSDLKQPIISAVIGWESAVFAPQFMACVPPLWIWGWEVYNRDGGRDGRTANNVPPTAEGRQLKRAFEKAAGKDYMRFAYQPEYRLARRLVGFAIDGGIKSEEAWREAREMIEEWKAIR